MWPEQQRPVTVFFPVPQDRANDHLFWWRSSVTVAKDAVLRRSSGRSGTLRSGDDLRASPPVNQLLVLRLSVHSPIGVVRKDRC